MSQKKTTGQNPPVNEASAQGVMASQTTGNPAAVPANAPERAAAPPIPDDPRSITEDIERTRQQLGETVEALFAKTDVKAQVAARLRAGTSRAGAVASRRRAPVAAAVCGIAIAGCLAVIWWRRR